VAAPTPKLAFVMVGLPARGKTFIARKIARYLSWLGHRTEVYNVGSYRRARLGRHRHEFFDPRNEAG
jgi:6-phosphofructo-2-kinase/fructose-2,6-biphosphatase 2